jgi:uncharacterized membrane protein (UPF0182 family)
MTHPPVIPLRGAGRPRRPSARKVVLAIVAALFLVFVVFPWFGGFATDWLWFREVHFEPVFFTALVWRSALFLAGAAVAFGLVYGNVRIATAELSGFPALYVDRGGGIRVDISRFVPRLFVVASIFVAFVSGLSASALWMTMLMALHGKPVGAVDSLFGRDIGFYLFTLPAISAALNTLLILTVLSLVVSAVVYGLRGELVLPPRKTSAGPGAARHLGILLALVFVMLGVRLWIVGAAQLLYSDTGPLLGASYTDVHVSLPAIRLSAIVAMLAAAIVIYGVVRRQLIWYAFVSVLLYAGVGIVFRGIAPTLVQKFSVAPNELSRERPYIAQHIAATRRAWRIDSVQTRELEGDVQLTMADIKANAPTIDNVRLWERDLLKQTFGQLQEIRTYYDFFSVNDDRYMIDGRYRQIHLSARELNTASLPTRNFINDRLTFTHGMGVTMAPVNQVTAEGLPVLFIKDVPPVSTVSIKVTRPQIYYGQMTNSYVFVGTAQKEFDYPAGETNVYTNYTGRGGVPVGSLMRRSLFAWQFDAPDIVLSSYITPGARILYHRNITDRARTALPFLSFDSDPYLIVTDAGELKWILDAYTSSENYPYSQRVQDGTNYMRNSVKVVIDAYDGTIDAYLADAADPIVQTYAAIFPGIFKPLSAMAADVRRHLRYPGDLFQLQADLHTTYHMVEPDAFYHREDQWQYPTVAAGSPTANQFMRHIILRLPGEKNPEYIFMTPFTPRGKDNLAAWMVARMDGDHYGQLIVYKFPKQSLVYGPKQIVNRINQDTDISRQLTLWDQKGSQVIRGELLVIPIEESLIYVQPIYLRAEGGTIPELKRVVVAHENRVAMGETLEEGLNLLFGDGTVAHTVATTAGIAGTAAAPDVGLIGQAQEHYDRAIAAQRAGDWSTYGHEIDQLGTILKQLRARKP